MKFLTLPFLLFCCVVGFSQATIVKFTRVEQILTDRSSDKIQVINFWATWCAPCIKELPLFERFRAQYGDKAKITLISLDYADKVDKVDAFIARKKLKSEVLLLDEIDGNTWIDKVEASWGGAIPITIVIDPKTGHRKFIDKELKDGDLEKIISSLEAERTN
jgi:thiol-disulfide isomerase/thioredoxin